MNGCATCGGFGDRHDPIAHGWDSEEECSDTCRRMVCEWCPEYDRQAGIVASFNADVERWDTRQ